MLLTRILFYNLIAWENFLFFSLLGLISLFSSPILNNRTRVCVRGGHINRISFLLLALTILTFFWSISYSSYLLVLASSNILIIFNLVIILFLYLFFVFNKVLLIYTSFELSVIPIFIIIMGWGYQSERLSASLSLIFYTLTASLPLLAMLLWGCNQFSLTTLEIIFRKNYLNSSTSALIFSLVLMTAFAVKLPIFGVHIWLPKAHVEAPVLGSMVLAAILLKLGRYGLWIFIQVVCSWNFLRVFISLSVIGGLIIRVLCVRLRDIKIIIAYSSVAHMGLVLGALGLIRLPGAKGGLLLMLAHGATSSAIFLIAYVIYLGNHSRRLLLTKGLLTWSYVVPLLWFLILISNMAAPPTFNLIAEIMTLLSLVLSRNMNTVILLLRILAGTAYTLILFRSSSQGRAVRTQSLISLQTLELTGFINHLFWIFLIIFRLDISRF